MPDRRARVGLPPETHTGVNGACCLSPTGASSAVVNVARSRAGAPRGGGAASFATRRAQGGNTSPNLAATPPGTRPKRCQRLRGPRFKCRWRVNRDGGRPAIELDEQLPRPESS